MIAPLGILWPTKRGRVGSAHSERQRNSRPNLRRAAGGNRRAGRGGNSPGAGGRARGRQSRVEALREQQDRRVREAGLASFHITPPATDHDRRIARHRERAESAATTWTAILVQMPLPKQIDSKKILDAVIPAKDVDGFHPRERRPSGRGPAGAGGLHAGGRDGNSYGAATFRSKARTRW